MGYPPTNNCRSGGLSGPRRLCSLRLDLAAAQMRRSAVMSAMPFLIRHGRAVGFAGHVIHLDQVAS